MSLLKQMKRIECTRGLTTDKIFNVQRLSKSIYHNTNNEAIGKEISNFIWMRVSPPRAQFTLWLLAHGKLKTE